MNPAERESPEEILLDDRKTPTPAAESTDEGDGESSDNISELWD